MTDQSWVDVAFPPTTVKSLNKRVRDALADPKIAPLLTDIGAHIISLSEPSAKKRKLDTPADSPADSQHTTGLSAGIAALGTNDSTVLKVEGISFSVPQRKKFNLLITTGGISAVAATGGDKVEFGVEWDNVDYIACLPVPDKSARQFNFCIFPLGSDGLSGSTGDAIVFTIADGEPKFASGDALSSGYDTSSYKSLIIDTFNAHLSSSKSRINSVEEPKEGIFFSNLAQSHRKGEKAFHVKAHRGSKEGYLFFLSRGILWAFKKPLVYFSFGNIDSVSYTSITKRTFNLSIKVQEDRGGGEVEFSMIDQEDYPGIDGYIKARRLNDASMAEMRKAKYFGVNGKGEEDEPGLGELEKALYDAEDEEEEDYDPNAEDGSDDGEGDSDDDSEEDSDEDGDGEMESDGEGSVDLREELGSEMEDVEPDEPKQKRARRGGR
ncbi:hypothetical protein BZA77DRAFT_267937 [Pyronema omphalodes]|nr:hypothetical protein BZA77DRAFT_267937 [Pyronema omphalodes]